MGKQQGLNLPCERTARFRGRPYGGKKIEAIYPNFSISPLHPSIHKNNQTIKESKSHLLLKVVDGELKQTFDGVLHEEHRPDAWKKEVIRRQNANAYRRLQQGRVEKAGGRMGSN